MERSETADAPVFQGTNPDYAGCRTLPIEERSALLAALAHRNRSWLERRADELGAGWLLVVDGKVVRWGRSWHDYLTEAESRDLVRTLGKYPIHYVRPELQEIEELHPWSAVAGDGDEYPTVPMIVSGAGRRWEPAADLDTGSPLCFMSAEELTGQGVLTMDPADWIRPAVHLGITYGFVPKEVGVRLSGVSVEAAEVRHTVLAVVRWAESPFVRINPLRTALVGRDVLGKLGARLVLDFRSRCTQVV